MKKNLWIIIVVVTIVLIGGFSYFSKSGKGPGQSTKVGSTETKKDIFSSIKDAMSRSLSLKCEYQGTEGKTTTYIKGSMVRVMYEVSDDKTKSGNAIIKDNKMWIWTEGEKEGIVLEISEKDTTNPQANKEKILEELEKFKDKCSSSVVSDSMFSPPSGIVFKDLSKFQEEMMKNLDTTGVPTDTSGEPSQ
jgi:hypothetical protein